MSASSIGVRALVTTIAAAWLGAGCVRHIYPYNHKTREYENDAYAETAASRTQGSLYSDASHGLFEDARGKRVGDIVTVAIDERSDANRDAATETSRASDTALGVSAFLSAMQSLATRYPGLDPALLVGASSESEFAGKGATSRSGKLAATLPVRIKQELPNGDLYVEGSKVILLNDEESYLYLSGVIRPMDIAPDNTVPSSVLADVELEYTGRGVISERQSPGWFSRVLDYVWPF